MTLPDRKEKKESSECREKNTSLKGGGGGGGGVGGEEKRTPIALLNTLFLATDDGDDRRVRFPSRERAPPPLPKGISVMEKAFFYFRLLLNKKEWSIILRNKKSLYSNGKHSGQRGPASVFGVTTRSAHRWASIHTEGSKREESGASPKGRRSPSPEVLASSLERTLKSRAADEKGARKDASGPRFLGSNKGR